MVEKIIEKVKMYDELPFKVNDDDILSLGLLNRVKDNISSRKVHKAKTSVILFEPGNKFGFGSDSNGSFIMGSGWYNQEASGVWSKETGELHFNFPKDKDAVLDMSFGFCDCSGDLCVNLNGTQIAVIPNNAEWDKKERLVLPSNLFVEGLQKLELRTINPGIPKDFKEPLGVFIRFISFAEAGKQAHQNVSFGYNIFSDNNFLDDALSRINASDEKIRDSLNDVKVAAHCGLPENISFRFFRRLVRKFIRSYTFFQIQFNDKIHDLVRALIIKMSASTEIVMDIQRRQQEQLSEFYEEFTLFKETNKDNSKRFDDLNKRLDRVNVNFESTGTDIWEQIEKLQTDIQNQWKFNHNVNENFNSIWSNSTNINKNFDSVWSAYQSLRRELFYELDFRLRKGGVEASSEKTVLQPKVKESYDNKVAQNGGKIKINIGSGPLDVEGYISVDARDLPNIDVVSDVSNMPFDTESVDEIYSAHLLEHFEGLVLEKELLPYWFGLLKPGGTFVAIVPDLDAMAREYASGNMAFSALAEVIMGAQDYKLDYHYNVFSPEVLVEMLKQTGFKETSIKARGRKNGQCYETEISAIK